MKVYIACHHPDPANALADALTAAGHEVVSNWHHGTLLPRDNNFAAWRDEVRTKPDSNAVRIRQADALVLIAGPDKYAGGKFVEFACAGENGKKLFIVGRVENGLLWMYDFTRVDTADDVVRAIGA